MADPHKKQDAKDYAGWIVTWSGHKNLPTHTLCRTCKQVKPAADFKYRVTKAKAKGWGKPGKHAYYASGYTCASCRAAAPARKPADLPLGALEKRVEAGDVAPDRAAEILRARHAKKVGAVRAAQQRRWLEKYKSYCATTLHDLKKERKWVRLENTRLVSDATLAAARGPQPLRFYMETYYTILRRIEAMFAVEFSKDVMADRLPAPRAWQDWLRDEEHRRLTLLYTAARDEAVARWPYKSWEWMNNGEAP